MAINKASVAVTGTSIRKANDRLMGREAASGSYTAIKTLAGSVLSQSQKSGREVDRKRVAEVASRSLPAPQKQKK